MNLYKIPVRMKNGWPDSIIWDSREANILAIIDKRNGNTLITEGSDGRIFEVTADHELVWEYINPYSGGDESKDNSIHVAKLNMVYRAYRAPYEWIPQLEKPEETAIEKIDIKFLRVPGAAGIGASKITEVAGVGGYNNTGNFCVISDQDSI